MIINKTVASAAISRLLIGATLDCFRVYSTVLQLAFYRDAIEEDIPKEVWISCSGNVNTSHAFSKSNVDSTEDADFFTARKYVVGEIYSQIGAIVDRVFVDESGVLKIDLAGMEIEFRPDKDCFEEVWAVMSDSPNQSESHNWYIALDDAGQLGGTIPAATNPK